MNKLVFLILLCCGWLSAQEPVNIVHKGSVRIAEELAVYLKLSLDRPCRIFEEKDFPGGPAFYVGPTEYAARQGFKAGSFLPGGWAYKSIGKNVVLTGHPHEGTANAVYNFLENELGVRWYTFESTFIPKSVRKDFSGLDRSGCPAFGMRGIYSPPWNQKVKNVSDIWRFYARNRLNMYGSLDCPANVRSNCHNFYDYVSPEKYFKTHPEYFSMNENGERFHGKKRYGGQLCMTNPEVADIAAATLESFILSDRKKLSPQKLRNIYDISQLDNTSWLCLCPQCKALSEKEGSDAALVLTFINRIARKIAVKYPEVTIRTFAYVSSEKAPHTIRPEKNVLIQICDLYTRSDCYRPLTHPNNAERRKIFDSWKEKGARIAVWDYWNMASPNGPEFNPPRVETMIDAIPGDLRYLKRIGAVDYFTEAEVDFFSNIPNFYDLQFWLGMKLLEDPARDENALIADFMKHHYGPAEKPMTDFLNLLRRAVREEKATLVYIFNPVREYQTSAFLKQCYAHLQSARKLTEPGTPYRLRVEKEMITPLAVMIANGKTGFAVKQLAEEYRQCRLGQIEAYAADKAKAGLKKKLDKDLERMTLVLDIPEKFKDIPADRIRQFAWPSFSGVVSEPESPLGKAMSSPEKETAGRKHLLKPQAGGLLPVSFGVYDNETKKGIAMTITPIPQDEKYHWYKVGRFEFGKQSFLWAWFWHRNANLRSVWTNADGLTGFNTWNVWISVRITGPAYVKGSQKKNAVLLDRVVLTPVSKK
ncbi:MAG: DUF4838 domain-containing protein [Lentisphaerae bacterium]|nr:DUF4838 domain-containing protein [Lentisphaerota bacterium]